MLQVFDETLEEASVGTIESTPYVFEDMQRHELVTVTTRWHIRGFASAAERQGSSDRLHTERLRMIVTRPPDIDGLEAIAVRAAGALRKNQVHPAEARAGSCYIIGNLSD